MDQNDRVDRGSRDAAGVGPYAHEREGLVPLSTLSSWSVSDGEPDVRGWEVRTVAGRHLGSVKDLLIDAKAGEVVMLDVDLAGSDQHSLVPIRVAQIDRGRRIILMDSADLTDVTARGPVGTNAVEAGDATAQRVVRYPDREVVVERTRLVDDVAPPADYSASSRVDRDAARDAQDAATDRRRAERRKIDRMSTDF